MKRLTLLLIFYSSISLGCECGKSIKSSFLSRVKDFDLIVLGIFKTDEQTGEISLIIDTIYKGGEFETQTIKFTHGGIDCNHLMDFKDGEKILIGLNKSPSGYNPDSYFANGCVTSSLLLTEGNIIRADDKLTLPAFNHQKIGLISKSMKLHSIEKKIFRRIT